MATFLERTPHFAFPFQFKNGRAVTTDQDTNEEILDCVELLLNYSKGSRADDPNFGVPPQLFTEAPIDPTQIAEQVELYEPRVRAIASTDDGEAIGDVIERIQISIRAKETI